VGVTDFFPETCTSSWFAMIDRLMSQIPRCFTSFALPMPELVHSESSLLLLYNLDIFFFCSKSLVGYRLLRKKKPRTFHFSISVCLELYCLTKSSNTFFNPSELVFKAGMTSFTVLSTRTPFIIRKHFLSAGRGSRVSSTSLRAQRR